ncbi:hypothetical protein PMAYCL1PPCAC_31059, partial [Pristionchus mayeri]
VTMPRKSRTGMTTEKWKRYYVKEKETVDVKKIRKRWSERGKEIHQRLIHKRAALANPRLSDAEKEEIKAASDLWCRGVYSDVARHIGCKASQFPPYQIVNGSDKLGVRVVDLTYSFGTYRVHYTLGGLLERFVAMKIERRQRMEMRKERREKRKERMARRKELSEEGEVESEEEEEGKSSDDSDEDDEDSGEDISDDEEEVEETLRNNDENLFKVPSNYFPSPLAMNS